MILRVGLALVMTLILAGPLAARADTNEESARPNPWTMCAKATNRIERQEGIPRQLLRAISKAESGRYHDGQAGGDGVALDRDGRGPRTLPGDQGRRHRRGRGPARARHQEHRCRLHAGEPAGPSGRLRQPGGRLRSAHQRDLCGLVPEDAGGRTGLLGQGGRLLPFAESRALSRLSQQGAGDLGAGTREVPAWRSISCAPNRRPPSA